MKRLGLYALSLIFVVFFACGGELPVSGDLVVDTVLDHSKVIAGGTTHVKCVVHDVYGNQANAPTDVVFQTPKGVDAPDVDKGAFVLTKSGIYHVACRLKDTKTTDDSPAELTVLAGPPVKTVTIVDPDHVKAGEAATARCTALDKYNNPVMDAKVVLDPVKNLDIEGMQVKSKVPGKYEIGCSVQGTKIEDKTTDTLTVSAGKPVRVKLTAKPMKKVYNVHNKVTLTYTVYDAFNNVVPGIHGEITAPAKDIKALGKDQYQFMAEGTFKFTVTLEDPYSEVSDSLTLICDMGPPVITITNPDRGMTFMGKASLDVQGTVTDAGAGVKWVRVNGNDVSLDEKGAFDYVIQSVHGLNPILVQAMDKVGNKAKVTRGYYYSTDYIPYANNTKIDDVVLSDGGMLYMGQKALDDGNHDPSHINDLATIVEVLLANIDYGQLLGQLPPMRYTIPNVINFTVPGLNLAGVKVGVTGDLTLEAKVTNIVFGQPHVSLQLEDGGINSEITLQPVSVSLEITATITNGYAGLQVGGKQVWGVGLEPSGTTQGSATIGKLLVDTDVMISKQPSDPKTKFEMKNFHVETQDIDIQPITSFVIDLGTLKIPPPVDKLVGTNTLQLGQVDLTKYVGGLSKLIADKVINPLLNSQLTKALSKFMEPLVAKVMTLAFGKLINMLVLDKTFDLPLGPLGKLPLHIKTSLSTVEFTKIAATIGLNIGTLTKKNVKRDPLGSILRDGCLSREGEAPFKFHKDPSIQLGGRYDFINEVIFTAWWSGMLNQTFDLGKLGGGGNSGKGMSLDGTVITPNFLLPPILDDCNPDGAQEIQVGDLYLDLKLDINGFKPHVGMWVQAKADAEIAAHGNEIGIKINKITYIETEIFDLGGLGPFKGILDSLVPMLKSQIQGKEFTFPIPPIDLGSMIPGLPPGSKLQLGNMTSYHEHGFGTVGGDLQ